MQKLFSSGYGASRGRCDSDYLANLISQAQDPSYARRDDFLVAYYELKVIEAIETGQEWKLMSCIVMSRVVSTC